MPDPSPPYPSAELDLKRIVGLPLFRVLGPSGNRAFGFKDFPSRLRSLNIFGDMTAQRLPSRVVASAEAPAHPLVPTGSRFEDPQLTGFRDFYVSGFHDCPVPVFRCSGISRFLVFVVPGSPDLWEANVQAFDWP